MRIFLLSLWVTLAGACPMALADTPKMARQLTIDDGLSQSTVHAIHQARDGRIWFATGDGVSIFDGENFSYLYRSETPDYGLQDNYIFGLREDPAGRIWVGTLGGGASIYSQSGEFLAGFHAPEGSSQSALLNDVYDFAYLPDGTVWIATGDGTLSLSATEVEKALSEGRIHLLPDVTHPTAAIRALALAGGQMLIGTQAQGLLLLDDTGANPRPIRTDNSGLKGDRIMDLFAETPERIWIATEDGGLNLLELRSMTVTQPIDLPDSDVESIARAEDGRLWFGTWSHGIFVHDPTTGETINHRAHQGQSLRLGSNSVIALTPDQTGHMWAGTYDRGANSLSQFTDPFETYFADPDGIAGPISPMIWALEEGVDNDLWVGTKEGLSRLFRDEKRFEAIDLGAGRHDVRAILRHGNRLLLAVRGQGLLSYDWVTGIVEPAQTTPPGDADTPVLQDQFIRLLMRDQQGQIWVGTHSGVFLLDPDLRQIRHFRKHTGELPHDRTRSLYESPNGYIWIGTSGGLTRFDPATGTTETFSGPVHFADNDVRAVYCLPDGRLLVGTQAGVSILTKDMDFLGRIERKDGLPNETIYSLLPDESGDIWIMTNNGLARYTPDSGAIEVFRARDGVQGAEFNFNAYARLAKDTLAVGGINGLSLFKPAMLEANPLPPVVSITPATQGGAVQPLPSNLVAPAQLSLDIAVTHYTDPTANRLRWRLDPVDADWQNARGTLHKLRRENLAPGDYTLHFQGIGSVGAAAPAQSLSFHVAPPLHLRWYAVLTYILCAIGGMFLLLGLRTRALKQRAADLEVLVQQKTRELVAADEERSRFYARAAHEIRTPISLIKAPLQSIGKTAELSAHNNGLLELVLRAVDRLVRLTDEMSDVAEHRRGIGSKQVSVDLPGVIDPILALYNDSATVHRIKFKAEVAPMGAATLDLEALELILHNLLSNAVRHTPAGGQVSVRIALRNQQLELMVENQARLPEQTLMTLRGINVSQGDVPKRGSEIIGAMVRRSGAELDLIADPARITLRFPARHQAVAPNSESPRPSPTDTPTPQILIVEDDRELRHYLTEALADIGQIRAAASCATARHALQQVPLSLVICDVMLPDGSGFDLIREMKEAPETSHIPALFLTALSDAASIEEGLAAWGDDYVTKPFDIDTLRSKVRLRLRNSEAIRTHMRARHTDPMPQENDPIIAPADARLLEQIEQQLIANLDQTEFSIDALAQHCALSKRNLQRKLSALYGLSFSQLLAQRRVEHAAKLLQSGLPVKEVCRACGYKNPSSFARKFKSVWGMQPSEFRKNQ